MGWSRGTGPPRTSKKKKTKNSYIFTNPDRIYLGTRGRCNFSREQNIYIKYSLKLANERGRTLKNPPPRVIKLFFVLYVLPLYKIPVLNKLININNCKKKDAWILYFKI
uniref:Uncharacterized protein n=1 Tax=Schizaphis graminum TaxID=13262 RepID=A0A2S2PBQ2_SCHGA